MSTHRDETRQRETDTGLRTYYTDLDRAVLEKLGEQHREDVPKERLEAMAKLPTEFATREEFRQKHRERTGASPENGTVGFSHGLERPAVVRTDQEPSEVVATLVHERLHQLSDPRARETLPKKTYEGMTENLAQHELGRTPKQGDRVAYPEGTMQSEALRNHCGEKAIRDAYFKGDNTELKRCLNQVVQETEEECRKRLRNSASSQS